nr:hypothetical protein GCM10020093_023480 [Planobispora longispora]
MTTNPRRQLRPTDVKRLNRTWRRNTEGRLALIVESVTGPFNIGSVFRTAAAFGVEHIWLAGNATPRPIPRRRRPPWAPTGWSPGTSRSRWWRPSGPPRRPASAWSRWS